MINWIQVTSGRGPEECCWVVAQVVDCIHKSATKKLKVQTLETICGDKPNTLKSALLAVEGDAVSNFITHWEGTIQWVGKSMFRPKHKRKNWFVGVSSLSPFNSKECNEKDIKIDKMRASGPGGQHVNKTESAIRVTHIPTGLIAVAQEERSQYLNKKLALSRLSEKLKQFDISKKLKNQQERWNQHNILERGNPVLVYEGKKFMEVA